MKINIEKILKTQAATIDEAIEKYIPRYFSEDALVFKLSHPQFTISFRALDKTIAEPIWEFLDRGGKRWRPSLFLLICEALGKDAGEFIEFATIPEVIHNGTLMIDDIEDNSKLRRGKPCTHTILWTLGTIDVGETFIVEWTVRVIPGTPDQVVLAFTTRVDYEDASSALPPLLDAVEADVMAPSFAPILATTPVTVERGDELSNNQREGRNFPK